MKHPTFKDIQISNEYHTCIYKKARVIFSGHPWVIIFIVAAVILLIISVFIPPFPTWFNEVPSYAKIRIPKVSLMAQQVENQRSKKKPVGTRNGIKSKVLTKIKLNKDLNQHFLVYKSIK